MCECHQYQRKQSWEAEEQVSVSFMEEAEIVFTTLSSTGRRLFSRLSRKFDLVLIDEAAQASEVATLQALAFGCGRCDSLPCATRCRVRRNHNTFRSFGLAEVKTNSGHNLLHSRTMVAGRQAGARRENSRPVCSRQLLGRTWL